MLSLRLKRRTGTKAEVPATKKLKSRRRLKRQPQQPKNQAQPAPEVKRTKQPPPEKGDVVYKVVLSVFGGLSHYRIKKGKITKAGKLQLTAEFKYRRKHDREDEISTSRDNIPVEGFFNTVHESVWRNSYSTWGKYSYAATLEGVEIAKEQLRIEARDFFGEAAAVIECAVAAVKTPKIREERYGF